MILGGRRRQRGAGLGVDGGVVDIDDQPRHTRPAASASPAVVIAAIGAASVEHEPDPGVGQPRVDRQIGRPGLEHRQHRHDRLGGPRQQQRHTLPRAHPLRGQQMRQPIRRPPPARGRSVSGPRRSPPPPAGVRATCAANNSGTDTGVLAGSVSTARLPHSSRRACSSASSRSIDDNRRPVSAVTIAARLGGHRHQHPPESLDQRLDAGRVEHVGAKLHRPADPGRLTGLSSSVRPAKTPNPCGRCGCRPAAG